jgi:hypothetical protein
VSTQTDISLVTDLDPTALADGALDELVASLFAEEKRVSAKRTSLHKRIDFLRTGGYAHLDASAEQLTTLQAEDRQLSDERQAIHAQVDAAVSEQRKRASERKAVR